MATMLRRSGFASIITNRQLLSASFGHFSVDAYANLLPMAYPILMASMGLDYSQIGLAIAMHTLAASLAQPLFGYIADKSGGNKYMGALGVAWIATLIALIGFSWDYWSFLAIVTLSGLGPAAFHPQGAMHASQVGGERKASAMSIFTLGGNVGFALGPMIGAYVFGSVLGLHGAMLLLIFGYPSAFWLYKAIGKVDDKRQKIKTQEQAKASPATNGMRSSLTVPIIGVAALVVVVTLRQWAHSALTNFIPLLFQERGLSQEFAGQILFILLAAVAVGGVIGGIIADEIGGKKVTFTSLVLAAPAVFLFFQSSGLMIPVLAIIVGLLLGASFSVTLVMGQQLLPNNLGVASGLILGLGFGAGGIGIGITGAMADQFGLITALNTIWLLPLLGALLCLGFKAPKPRLEGKG